MKKIKILNYFCLFGFLFVSLCSTFSFTVPITVYAEEEQQSQSQSPIKITSVDLGIKAESALLMEAETGMVLYEANADESFPPASVTKIMSLLLIMESIDTGKISLDEKVSASEHACSMGGSQVFLEPGEIMSVTELLKCVVVSSANDATVALAEHVMGSADAFIARMNERAKELGMNNTVFKNTTGLDEDGHVSSARDIAIMSRELIKHKKIFEYTTIWVDSIRNGEFGLSNTNKLIRFYSGANGLKTGSTSIAKYCLSGTALRNDMQLIAVVMGAPTSDDRFSSTKKMLDYGFATYTIAKPEKEIFEPLRVLGGVKDNINILSEDVSFLVGKGQEKNIKKQITIDESVKAPVNEGDTLGTVKYFLDDKEIKSVDIKATESVERISAMGLFVKMLNKYLMIS